MTTSKVFLTVVLMILIARAAAADECRPHQLKGGETMTCCKKKSEGAGKILCDGPQKLEGPYACSEKIEISWECKFTPPLKDQTKKK